MRACKQLVEAKSSAAKGIELKPLQFESNDDSRDYKYVKVKLNREQRYADLTVHGPEGPQPTTAEEIQELGDGVLAVASLSRARRRAATPACE